MIFYDHNGEMSKHWLASLALLLIIKPKPVISQPLYEKTWRMKPKNMVIKDKEQNKNEFFATFFDSCKSGQTKALQWVITDEMLFHTVVCICCLWQSSETHQLSSVASLQH